ncbi:thrombospondin type-1 domain-containing protein 4-like isoform X2 [Littorina saxatilis]|uniref:thrombospondin type-1 domain-containing protein 4-like isoform X2 n=1 Tax=Littorina saxatilis TaxID=31220 RepID=UPI0038B4362C
MVSLALRGALVIFVILAQILLLTPVNAQRRLVDTCKLCERRPESCRRIAGLYTVTVLTKGTYNPVVEIPPQACSINITELAPSQNYLALKTDRDDNIVNGHWSVGSVGSFRGVGTVFEYNRGASDCPGECITSPGPTDRRVVVQILYYNKNPGIAYSFVLPNDVAFKPFDEVAPKVEARSRSHHRRGSHGTRQNRQGTAFASGEQHDLTGIFTAFASDAEPYDSGIRRVAAAATQVHEPRASVTSHRRRTSAATASSSRARDLTDARTPANAYRGRTYGSHTLGGRGQSYTYQYTDNKNTNNPAVDRSKPSSSSSSVEGQYTPSRGSLSRSRTAYDSSRTSGVYSSGSNRPRVPAAATTTSRRRPTFARRPYIRREQAPTWTKPETPTFISAYDNSNNNNNYRDTSRGLQTLASSSRGGLVDRTFSRGVEANNRLQTFERPVERRPVLTIGTGGSGNEYEWTISGLTECSRTCGGGTQETEVVCVLTSSGTQVVVTPDNCQNALKPRIQRVSCNNDPCTPGWETEEWSECSVTCGGGTQSRRIECRQRFSQTLELSVSASQCDQANKPAVAQQCNNDPCATWRTGAWGECSAECGGGEKQRTVECIDGQRVQIPDSYCSGDKPAAKEQCNSQACNTQWWHSHWSDQCSADCGSGVTTRHVICTDRSGRPVTDTACVRDQRPRDRKRCESTAGCGNVWFTGTWSQCSDSCGQGIRTREVLCMERQGGSGTLIPTQDDHCSTETKPSVEEPCFNTACGSQYYMTAWSQCTVTCGSGVKTRDVKCLDENQQPSRSCDRSRAPSSRDSCELSLCRDRQEVRDRPPQTSRTHGNCKNTFWNCRLVAQARLCPYYKEACCAACRDV